MFSRSWTMEAMTDRCQKEVERTQQRQGTDWLGSLSEKNKKSYWSYIYKQRK